MAPGPERPADATLGPADEGLVGVPFQIEHSERLRREPDARMAEGLNLRIEFRRRVIKRVPQAASV